MHRHMNVKKKVQNWFARHKELFRKNGTSCLSEKNMVSALTWVVSTLIARKTPVTSPSCPGAGARGPPWGPRRWKSCAITNCKNRHTKRATTSKQHTDGQTVPCQPHAGLPPYIQPSSEPHLHYYLAEQTILKTMHYLNTWYTNQFNNQQWTPYPKRRPMCTSILNYILREIMSWTF